MLGLHPYTIPYLVRKMEPDVRLAYVWHFSGRTRLGVDFLQFSYTKTASA